MHLEDRYLLHADASTVAKFLKDLKAVSGCIPYLESFRAQGPKQFTLVVRPSLAFLKGKLTMDCSVLSMSHKSGMVKIEGKTLGGSFTAVSQFRLSKKGRMTELRWSVDVTLKGLLTPVPEGVISGTAQLLAEAFLTCLERNLKIYK